MLFLVRLVEFVVGLDGLVRFVWVWWFVGLVAVLGFAGLLVVVWVLV